MSKQMFEAAWRGALDRTMLEELDEPWNLECEHQLHGTEPAKHEGPATHWVTGPCDRIHGFRCNAIVQHFLRKAASDQTYRCGYCKQVHAYSESVFTPLVTS